MARLAALLGSINVGGARVRMAELSAALDRAGFANVETVTASGNVVFDGNPAAQADYARLMAEVIETQFGIATFAVILSRDKLLAAALENPFAETGQDNLVHVHFLDAIPAPDAFAQLVKDHAGQGPERLAPGTGVLHIDFVAGLGSSKLSGPFIAMRFGCRVTARNIRSIRRIAEAMG
jgi:uncharacterized protein (DUF1697 family)